MIMFSYFSFFNLIFITEMDFYVMKRKKLQQLCKKHGIPANLGNIEMANSLTFLLKVTGKFIQMLAFPVFVFGL